MQFRHTNRINRINRMHVPTWITVLACVLLAWHGPIAQPAHYHDFADQQMCYGKARCEEAGRGGLGSPVAAGSLGSKVFGMDVCSSARYVVSSTRLR